MAELGVDKRSTRSRSKTPSILASENGNSDKKSKKIPTISLIEEEDDVVEVFSQPGKKRQRRSAKAATDTSPDVSPMEVKSSQKETVSSRTSVVTTKTVTETVQKSTNGESSASTTTTTNVTKFGATEVPENQSIFNNIFNAIKTSTPILANKRSKRVTETINSSLTVNGAEHPAYKE